MRRILCFSLLILSLTARSQVGDSGSNLPDSVVAKMMKLNFQAPDNPAFKSLDLDPSNILRPNDIKTLAFALAPYVSTTGIGLPKNLAIEFSPGRVASKNWSITDYEHNAWKRFYANTAFSLATAYASGNSQYPFKVSAGLRYQWRSKEADPFNQEYLYNLAGKEEILKDSLETVFIKLVRSAPGSKPMVDKLILDSTTVKDKNNSDYKKKFQTWYDAKVIHLGTNNFATRKKLFEEKNWNATRIDFAFAWVGQAGDSTLGNIKANFLNAWVVGAFKLGENCRHSQLLLGLTYRYNPTPDSTDLIHQGTVNVRYYYGDVNMHGFVELQPKLLFYQNKPIPTYSLLFNCGLEAKITPKIGIVASVGIENMYEPHLNLWSRLRSGLNLRYSIQ